jgi:hypothetical protein
MLNSTVFPKPYMHTPTHTGISQRRAPQIKKYTMYQINSHYVKKVMGGGRDEGREDQQQRIG